MLKQTDLVEFCKKNQIVFQAYSSLGTSDADLSNKLLRNNSITELAKKYERTEAQILLKWAIQDGICNIKKNDRKFLSCFIIILIL